MIDENLCRAELGPADRASQSARRKAIYLELHPETGHGKASPSKDDKLSSFAAVTAEAIGKTERTVQRDPERGEKVSEDALNLVRGTALDTGSNLDKLKREICQLAKGEELIFSVLRGGPVSPPRHRV